MQLHANNETVAIDLSKASDTLMVKKIYIVGNKKTKAKIILNEILFKENQSIATDQFYSLVGKSRQNLKNTSLFNFVYLNYWLLSNNEIAIEVKVDERWYLWALPIFEQGDRNFSSFVQSGDWSRVNYGLYLKQENFRGMNELIKLKLQMGFNNEIELSYRSADYNNRLSWGTVMDYNTNHQVSYNIVNDQPINIKHEHAAIQQRWSASLFLNYRRNYFHRHTLVIGYNAYHIKDTLATINPDYLLNGNTSLVYLNVGYRYNFDKRDNRPYPLKGHLVQASLYQSGLGIISDEYANLSAKLGFEQYGNINGRFYYGWNLRGTYNSAEKRPFVAQTDLGFKEFLNGYEFNVIEGGTFGYTKQKIAFELIPTKTAYLKFINLNQFSKFHYALYLKAFVDGGYVYNQNPKVGNELSNTFLYSFGLGFDLVTYYDKVLSINYSVNKQGLSGFYIHLDMPM